MLAQLMFYVQRGNPDEKTLNFGLPAPEFGKMLKQNCLIFKWYIFSEKRKKSEIFSKVLC